MADMNAVIDADPSIVRRAVRRVLKQAKWELELFGEARRAQKVGAWSRAFVVRQYWAWAAAGSIVFGLALPILLVVWNSKGQFADLLPGMGAPVPQTTPTFWGVVETLVGVTFFAMAFCGPIAAVLAVLVYVELRRHADKEDASLSYVVKRGAVIAGVAAFVNVPGYLAGVLMPAEHPVPMFVRLPVLFIVAGVTCGMWIAWQAWRASRPMEPVLPRFSLSWLLMLVIAWGAVMAVFAPV